MLPHPIKKLIKISTRARVSLDLHGYPFNYSICRLVQRTHSHESREPAVICFTDRTSLQFAFIKSAVLLLSQCHYPDLLISP